MLEPLDHALTAALRADDRAEFHRLGLLADQQQTQRAARLAAPDALAAAARWYAAQGIPVFPLRPQDKRPLFPSAHQPGSPERATCRGECGTVGHGLYDATTNPTQVAAWWTARPQANIGIPTGHRFDVIDVDGPPGFQSLGRLREDGMLPPCLGKVRTPGNPGDGRPVGMHYLIAPTGDGNGSKILPGLDYRGLGGYVVAAPSVGPSGDRYDWVEPIALVTA